VNTIALHSWQDVVRALSHRPAGTILRVRKGILTHPRRAGMMASVGLPEGQSADWRKRLPGGRGLHVKVFGDHYEAHIDRVHPDVNPVEHLRQDAPGVFVGSGVALGAAVGAAMGRSGASTAVGAALGGVLAALWASAD